MGAFELDNNKNIDCEVGGTGSNNRKIKEECIIALKVYDSCRQQDCLTPDEIGPARAAESKTVGDVNICEGDVIDPPSLASAVTVDRLKVKKVIVVSKRPNPFKNGFWDIDLKYVFVYRLTFREADGTVIGSIWANSIFNKQITLFGSIGTDIVLSTDLFNDDCNDSYTLDSDPFILVESKAVALSAELRFQNRRCGCGCGDDSAVEPNEVLVTIGLFTIIKLFRIVNLTVESRGFCIPEECEGVSPLNPCEFFDSLDFPMDIFAPPQKPEFLAGISSNIPSKHCANNVGGVTGDCGCNCGCSCGGCGCSNCVGSSGNSCGCSR